MTKHSPGPWQPTEEQIEDVAMAIFHTGGGAIECARRAWPIIAAQVLEAAARELDVEADACERVTREALLDGPNVDGVCTGCLTRSAPKTRAMAARIRAMKP